MDSHRVMGLLVFVPALCGAIVWWAFGSQPLGLAVLGFLAGMLGSVMLFVRPRRIGEELSEGGPQRWEFDDRGVTAGHPLGAHRLRPWTAWARAVIYGDLIMLYRDDQQCIFLPARAFDEGDYDALASLLEEKLESITRRR